VFRDTNASTVGKILKVKDGKKNYKTSYGMSISLASKPQNN
jgi:hypothetical protein